MHDRAALILNIVSFILIITFFVAIALTVVALLNDSSLQIREEIKGVDSGIIERKI